MPINVFALAGNRKTKEAHFVTCAHAARISEKNFIWFDDLKDVKKHGYDTCEMCMPLICNTATGEAHKLSCKRVGKIRKINRRELRSWAQAEKLKFDGCKYCLPEKHRR
jgi:hypothetical protein